MPSDFHWITDFLSFQLDVNTIQGTCPVCGLGVLRERTPDAFFHVTCQEVLRVAFPMIIASKTERCDDIEWRMLRELLGNPVDPSIVTFEGAISSSNWQTYNILVLDLEEWEEPQQKLVNMYLPKLCQNAFQIAFVQPDCSFRQELEALGFTLITKGTIEKDFNALKELLHA